MSAMKPLILTGWSIPEFDEPEFADLTVNFIFRFGWGPLPSPDELATYLGPGTPDVKRGHHWSDFATGGTGAKTEIERISISAWLNSVSNTRPSSYGSTRSPMPSCN